MLVFTFAHSVLISYLSRDIMIQSAIEIFMIFVAVFFSEILVILGVQIKFRVQTTWKNITYIMLTTRVLVEIICIPIFALHVWVWLARILWLALAVSKELLFIFYRFIVFQICPNDVLGSHSLNEIWFTFRYLQLNHQSLCIFLITIIIFTSRFTSQGNVQFQEYCTKSCRHVFQHLILQDYNLSLSSILNSLDECFLQLKYRYVRFVHSKSDLKSVWIQNFQKCKTIKNITKGIGWDSPEQSILFSEQ